MKKLLLIALVFLFVSCEKSEIMDFTSGDCAVYFLGGSLMSADDSVIYPDTYRYADSMTFSFTTQKSTTREVIIGIPVIAMGKVKDYKRPIKVIVDEERTNAVRDVDYEVNLDTLSLPANAGKVSLRVILLRSDILLTETKRVAFRLLENEYFKLCIQSNRTSGNYLVTADTISAVEFAVVFNEQYSEPFYYSLLGCLYFGDWTPKKYQVLNEMMGWTDEDWNNAGDSGSKVAYGRFDFAAKALQRYLQEMANSKTPVLDSDGSYIQLADEYAVDYSKCDIKDEVL